MNPAPVPLIGALVVLLGLVHTSATRSSLRNVTDVAGRRILQADLAVALVLTVLACAAWLVPADTPIETWIRVAPFAYAVVSFGVLVPLRDALRSRRDRREGA